MHTGAWRREDTAGASPIDGMVYVVDDDPLLCGTIRGLCQAQGWLAEAYGSAEDFLDGFTETAPSCLVLDYALPGANGTELLDELATRGCRMPVIMMSGNPPESAVDRALRAGALEFFQKPVLPSKLLDTIRQALRLASEGANGTL